MLSDPVATVHRSIQRGSVCSKLISQLHVAEGNVGPEEHVPMPACADSGIDPLVFYCWPIDRSCHSALCACRYRQAAHHGNQCKDGFFHHVVILIAASKLGIFFVTGNRFGLFYPKTINFDCFYRINQEENESSKKILVP